MIPAVLSRRLVAFLDILGFSKRLETVPVGELHRTYSALIDKAISEIFPVFPVPPKGSPPTEPPKSRSNFANAQFLFDSIVLVSNPIDGDDGSRNVIDFMSATALLFEISFGRALPLRGCIGFDDVLVDETRQIFLSRTFPILVADEKKQQWAGVTLLPSAADEILNGLYGTPASELAKDGTGLLLRYPVPFRDNSSEDAWCLNWVYLCDARDLATGLTFLEGRKKEETQRFVDHVRSIARPASVLPENCRPAHRLFFQPARDRFRFKFVDIDGNGVDPPTGLRLNFMISVVTEGSSEGDA
jgi:hypothetical protein